MSIPTERQLRMEELEVWNDLKDKRIDMLEQTAISMQACIDELEANVTRLKGIVAIERSAQVEWDKAFQQIGRIAKAKEPQR